MGHINITKPLEKMTNAAQMTAQHISTKTRIETDSFGEIEVPVNAYWARRHSVPCKILILALKKCPPALCAPWAFKKAAALTNMALNVLDTKLGQAIIQAADEIMDGTLAGQFPLSVWQTGSGTQTNMVTNEVIAGRANEILNNTRGGKKPRPPQ